MCVCVCVRVCKLCKLLVCLICNFRIFNNCSLGSKIYNNYVLLCNGAEWSKDRTQAAESIKWRPQQAYGSNQVLLSQP